MTNKWLVRAGIVSVLVPLLAGCIALGSKAGRDPNFQAGYSDGCASATSSGADYRTGGVVRDEALYKASSTYRSGWGTGFASCNPRRNPAGTDPNMGGMPSQRPPGQL